MPDAKTIRGKMKRRMQNNRADTSKTMRESGHHIDMVDALIKEHFPNTPGAKEVQVEQAARDAMQDMQESGEDLLLRLYNALVPIGHHTLKLTDASDPRLT
jgi:hypothetical protein